MMVGSFFQFMWLITSQLWAQSLQLFLVILAVGILLAGLSWWLARYLAVGFNRQFALKPHHHLFFAVAAVITLVFTVLFFAMQYMEDVARHTVHQWEEAINADNVWSSDTFADAYDAVYELVDAQGKRLEDFTGHPHPSLGKNTQVPVDHKKSRETVAEVYVTAAVEHFDRQYPFLSLILWARSGVAPEVIRKDVDRYFDANPGGTYQGADAIRLAGREIRAGLLEQAPRVVLLSRVVLVLIFLILQGIVFGLMIYVALANIRERGISRIASQ